jgi:hypothetical protein
MLFSVGDDRAMWVLLPSLAMLFLVFHAGHLFFAIRHFTRRRN